MKTTATPSTPVRVPPDNESLGGSEERWTVGLVLSRSLTAEERTAFKAVSDPRLSAVCLRRDEGPMTIGVTAYGPMDEALSQVLPAVADSLRQVAAADVTFAETWMVSHADLEQQTVESQRIHYYSVTQCAQTLGISRQRVLQLCSSGKFPAPAALLGERPIWTEPQIMKYMTDRARRVDTSNA